MGLSEWLPSQQLERKTHRKKLTQNFFFYKTLENFFVLNMLLQLVLRSKNASFFLPHSQQVLLIFLFYGRNKGIALKLGEIWQRRERGQQLRTYVLCVVNALAYSLKILSNQKTSFCSADEILLLCCCYTDKKDRVCF